MKKRKVKESRLKAKRARTGRGVSIKSYGQVMGQEPAPFGDFFGTPDDIFADVLGSQDLLGSRGGSMMGSLDLGR